MFKDYVDIARSGDKVLQQGAISPPHTNIIRAFCNTPHFSTAVYTSECPCSGWDGFDFVVGLNPIVGRGKDAAPNIDKYNEYTSLKRAKILKQRLDPPAVSKFTKAGNLEKLTIEETEGWTIDPFMEGQEVLLWPTSSPPSPRTIARLNFDSITFTCCPSSQSPSSGPSPSRPRPLRRQRRRATHPTRSPRSSYSRTSSCAIVIP